MFRTLHRNSQTAPQLTLASTVLLVSLLLASTNRALAQGGTWSFTGSMNVERVSHAATLLPTGKVLVTGGRDSFGQPLATAELYDPATGQWTPTGSLRTARIAPSAILLQTGKVLVSGGHDVEGNPFSSAELYDPSTGQWTPTGSLNTPRHSHPAILLPDGKVLVAGGWPHITDYAIGESELYDPNTGKWTYTGSLNTPRVGTRHLALLPNGKVLFPGDVDCCPYRAYADAEVYDPSIGKWTYTESLSRPRAGHAVILLRSGEVLVAGGVREICCPWDELLSSAELYDPQTESWTPTGSMNMANHNHLPVILPDDRVLVMGGQDQFSGVFASAELYNPALGTWARTGSLNVPRLNHTATLLPNGKVLVAGGSDSSGSPHATAELYTPSLTPACAENVSSSVQVIRGGFRFNYTTQSYVQHVSLTNISSNPIQGPVALVLDDLSSNASLANSVGTTSCATPAGSPFDRLDVGTDRVLSPGETRSITLQFTNPTNQRITYRTRMLAGSNNR